MSKELKANICTVIAKHYGNYGKYVNSEKMFPSTIDGLLPVHRRLLTTLHMVAPKEYTKTAKIIGECMGRFHPHQMDEGPTQYLVINGFADGSGSWGCNIGATPIRCAAMRYTKIRSDAFIEKMAFRYINNVDWVEIDGEPEPVDIPTMFPFCLFGNTELNSIGFGFKTSIPNYEIKDLYNRLMFLLEKRKTKPIIKPKYHNCDVLSQNKELEEILKTGSGSVIIKGKYIIDKKDNCIYIKGWSPRQKFENILNKIDKTTGMLSSGDLIIQDLSSDDAGTNIMIQINKKRNATKSLTDLINVIDDILTSEIKYQVWTVHNGNVLLTSIDDMLLKSYEYYKKALENNLKETIEKLNNKIVELDLIEKIREHIPHVITSSFDVEKCIDYLNKKTKIKSEDIRMIINKYKIKTLLTVNTDITNIKNELKIIKNKLSNLEETCVNEYEEIFK